MSSCLLVAGRLIATAYEQQAKPLIEVQLERAGVRLAHLLNENLR